TIPISLRRRPGPLGRWKTPSDFFSRRTMNIKQRSLVFNQRVLSVPKEIRRCLASLGTPVFSSDFGAAGKKMGESVEKAELAKFRKMKKLTAFAMSFFWSE
ncbi:MAG: hypothetical protein PUC47_11940, partial [Oscillospiraceae bacterium]|nr:hypothetical protein [Oscillospiraceae bacterium]